MTGQISTRVRAGGLAAILVGLAGAVASAQPTAAGAAHTFQYDPANNLLGKRVDQDGAQRQVAFPLDGSGRNRPAAMNGIALEWNRNGNLVRRGDLRLRYDYRNRLTGVETLDGARLATYAYDTENRRVRQQFGASLFQTSWIDWQDVETYRDDRLESRRVYGDGLDEVLLYELDTNGDGQPDSKYFPIYDTAGNVAVITDTVGKPIERYSYTPYGARTIRVDSTPPAVQQVRVRGGELWLEVSEPAASPTLQRAVTAGRISLQAGGYAVAITADQPVRTGRQAGRRVVLRPAAAPVSGTGMTLHFDATALEDTFQNHLAAAFDLEFSWPASDRVLLDTAAPVVDAIDVRAGVLEIEFTEEVDLSTTSLGLQLDNHGTSWTLSPDRYRVIASAPAPAGSWPLVVSPDLKDLSGRGSEENFRSTLLITPSLPLFAAFRAPDPRVVQASTVGNLRGFKGLPEDPITGFLYMRNRYYDPEMGRFITADPMGYPDGPNGYAYVNGDPVNRADPLGLYQADVHMGVTYFLAMRAGFSTGDARTIAMADEAMDTSPATDPERNAAAGRWTVVIENHFPIDPTTGHVEPGGPKARARIAVAQNLGSFGRGLHLFQDSYSHSRAYWGNLTDQAERFGLGHCLTFADIFRRLERPEVGITHQLLRTPSGCADFMDAAHEVDYTWMQPGLALEMEEQTYEALKNLHDRMHLPAPAVPQRTWRDFRGDLEDFNRQDTKYGKRLWLQIYAPGILPSIPWEDLTLAD